MLEFFVSLLSKIDDHSSPLNLKTNISDYVIFSYFHNLVAKSDQKRKMGWTKHMIWFKNSLLISIVGENLCPWVALKRMVTIRYTQLLHFCDSFVANLWHGMSFKPVWNRICNFHCSKNEHIVLLSIMFFVIVVFLLKFRFSKEATKFETISHVIWRLLSKFQIKWEVVSNFCGLFRMSKL